MPSSSVTPDPSGVLTEERTFTGVDRVITWLSWWWIAAPCILLTPLAALGLGFPQVREKFGMMFAVAAAVSAVLAPVSGFVVALIGRRPRARRRFIIMGAVSSVPFLYFWVFLFLLVE